jgi:hypothetical protein
MGAVSPGDTRRKDLTLSSGDCQRDRVSRRRRPHRPDRRGRPTVARRRAGACGPPSDDVGIVPDGSLGRTHPPGPLHVRRRRPRPADQPPRRPRPPPGARHPRPRLRPRVGRTRCGRHIVYVLDSAGLGVRGHGDAHHRAVRRPDRDDAAGRVDRHPLPRRDRMAPLVPQARRAEFSPTPMYQRDDVGLPTGALVEPTSGPWDDCFVNTDPVVLRYDRPIASQGDGRRPIATTSSSSTSPPTQPASNPSPARLTRSISPPTSSTPPPRWFHRTMTISW